MLTPCVQDYYKQQPLPSIAERPEAMHLQHQLQHFENLLDACTRQKSRQGNAGKAVGEADVSQADVSGTCPLTLHASHQPPFPLKQRVWCL